MHICTHGVVRIPSRVFFKTTPGVYHLIGEAVSLGACKGRQPGCQQHMEISRFFGRKSAL